MAWFAAGTGKGRASMEKDQMTENTFHFNIEEELKKLPGRPGVYIMHDEHDDIIYVGKAISLKNRVRQYFQSSRNKSAKFYRWSSGSGALNIL